MRPTLTHAAALLLALEWGLGGAAAAHADERVQPLVTLVEGSTLVVIGTVSDVLAAAGERPGTVRARIVVEETLKGEATASLEALGNQRDADGPRFVRGARVLAFLRMSPRAGASYEPVPGTPGVVDLADGAIAPARSLLDLVLTRGKAPSLRDLVPFAQDGPERLPAALLASLLEEMNGPLAAGDDAQLASLACPADDTVTLQVQHWAIARVGTLKLRAAGACLETLLGGRDSAKRILAADALGAIGDPRSLPALTAALARTDGARVDRGLQDSVALALGRIGDARAVPALLELTRKASGPGVRETVVHALGLIGSDSAISALGEISAVHPDPQLREQASHTLVRLRAAAARGGSRS